MKFYTNVTRHKSDILVRGYSNKLAYQEKHRVKPYLFVPDRSGRSQYKSLYGDPAAKMDFNTISEARDFLSKYENVPNFPVYGITYWEYLYIFDNFKKGFEYNKDQVSIGYLDIEVGSKNGFAIPPDCWQPVTLITIRKNEKRFTFGCGEYKPKHKNQYYFKCRNEEDLFLKFLTIWQRLNFDIISGWNSRIYDIPYLYYRMEKILGAETARKLSPWSLIECRQMTLGKKIIPLVELVGISQLDMLELYKDQKFQIPKQDDYSLNTIASMELEEQKVDYSEYESLHEFYEKDYQKFVEYNIQDVDLVYRINEKRKLIDFVITIAYDYRLNYDDVLTSVKLWDVIIHNYCLEKKIVLPQKTGNRLTRVIEGGYVKTPIPGMYKWVVGFDVSSLYPNLIRSFNISPETFYKKIPDVNRDNLNEKLKEYEEFLKLNNLCMCANGCTYTRHKLGVLPELSGVLFEERSEIRSKMIDMEKEFEKNKSDVSIGNLISSLNGAQMGRKIILNSLFGSTGNEGFRFFSMDLAESITITGQYSIVEIGNALNRALNKWLETKNTPYVVYEDTDSVYITLDSFVEKYCKNKSRTEITDLIDKFCKEKLQKIIKEAISNICSRAGTIQNTLSMKRETISTNAIWTSKKRYLLNVIDSEGVRHKEPELKITGIEAVRSSTPRVCRESIKKTLKLLMDEGENPTRDFINSYKNEFMNLSIPEIASPRGVNGLGTYEDKNSIFVKGTPIHTKGALIYNQLLRKYKLEDKYQFITEGEKIKYCYLKEPNPLRSNVIAFPKTLPKEFNLEKYVDYNMQWEKGFLAPIALVFKAIGMDVNQEDSLEDFFT